MHVRIGKSALKALLRLQPARARQIREAISRAAVDPFAPNNNVKALKGVKNGYRIRVGDWRVSYTIDRASQTLDLFEIAPRGGAYR
jgi:mRNA interferase RelE/StbE